MKRLKLEKVLKEWKSYGAVSTPKKIIELMISLTGLKKWENLDIIEPACGFCNFLTAIYSKFPQNKFWGVEINDEVYRKIKKVFKNNPLKLIKDDFLLWQTNEKFDLVIGNPPYGIIGDKSHYPIHILKKKKAEYKKIFSTWYGKYNIYGAFIEKSVSLLKPDGRLVFIIPATWMILDEFKRLRKFLSCLGKTKVYYLGNNVFKGVSVSVCILVFEKGKKGVELYHQKGKSFLGFVKMDSWDGSILRFETQFTKNLEKGKSLLSDFFEIKISARSTEVKNFAPALSKSNNNVLPFLNGRNIKRGFIERKNYVGFWLKKERVDQLKSFYGVLPRIVVGHTKGGKIFSAVESEPYPYVGDVYHLLPKTELSGEELNKMVTWMNSEKMEKYMTSLYKEITPHTTATQLRKIPIDIKVDKGTLFG